MSGCTTTAIFLECGVVPDESKAIGCYTSLIEAKRTQKGRGSSILGSRIKRTQTQQRPGKTPCEIVRDITEVKKGDMVTNNIDNNENNM